MNGWNKSKTKFDKLERIQKGSLVWVNVDKRDPQKHSNEIRAYYHSCVGSRHIYSKAYGNTTHLLIKFGDNEDFKGKLKTGYLEKVSIL